MCVHHLICNVLVSHVQWITPCIIEHKVIMHTKMNTRSLHPIGCGVEIYYASLAQNKARMCWTTYVALQFGLFRGNNTHNKWDRSWTNPFGVVVYTTLVMHVFTVIIRALIMIYTSRVLEGQFKIVLDICSLCCAPRVSIIHLIYAMYWIAART